MLIGHKTVDLKMRSPLGLQKPTRAFLSTVSVDDLGKIKYYLGSKQRTVLCDFTTFLGESTMADISKLACTFEALRVTVLVCPSDVEKAMTCYKKAGLHPNLVDYNNVEKSVVIRVTVPVDPSQIPIGSVPRRFCDLTHSFDGEIKEAVKTQLICPLPDLKRRQSDLLKLVAITLVSGAKRFVCDDKALEAANIVQTDDNFKHLFYGKVEEDVPEADLAIYNLQRSSPDSLVRAELGEYEQTHLAWMVELIKEQQSHKSDILIADGRINVFYILGNDGNLWAVCAYWSLDRYYWKVAVHSVKRLHPWCADCQFISLFH